MRANWYSHLRTFLAVVEKDLDVRDWTLLDSGSPPNLGQAILLGTSASDADLSTFPTPLLPAQLASNGYLPQPSLCAAEHHHQHQHISAF